MSSIPLGSELSFSLMRKDALLILLNLAASILLWWPMLMVIPLVTHWWLPLPLIVLVSSLSTVLFAQRWWHFAAASGVGTGIGICTGYAIWRPADGVETAYSGLLIVAATLAAFLLSLLSNSAMRKLTLSNIARRQIVWIVLVCCFAIAPIALALTAPLVRHRVARDDRAAVNRLKALNIAAEKTMAEAGGRKNICDGNALQRNYAGPMFSQEDWRYITDNYVRRDGYVFRFYCQEKDGYAIEAWPARGAVDGTRRLCADEAHSLGCDIGSNGSRRVCKPCT
jgi:hypothetical protein